MASFSFNFDDVFKPELIAFDDIAEEALKEAAPVLVDEVKKAIDSSADRGCSKGVLTSSIKATKPSRTKTDAFVLVVRPTGKDEKGVRNMEKAMYLEYGTTKEAAKPWLAKASNNAESKCKAIMQEVINRRLK